MPRDAWLLLALREGFSGHSLLTRKHSLSEVTPVTTPPPLFPLVPHRLRCSVSFDTFFFPSHFPGGVILFGRGSWSVPGRWSCFAELWSNEDLFCSGEGAVTRVRRWPCECRTNDFEGNARSRLGLA